MNKDATFRLLVLVAVALLGYIVWMNTKEIVDLELELDKMKGAVGSGGMVGNPVPPASANDAADVTGQSFEETLGG